MEFTNSLLYTLKSFHRMQLIGFERDRIQLCLKAQDFVSKRLRDFELKILFEQKNIFEPDDGVDWFIEFENFIFVVQLKYYTKRIMNRKYAKQIYGEMILNKVSLKKRIDGIPCIYLLLVPFASYDVQFMGSGKIPTSYYIFSNEKFVEFLINPYLCLKKIMEKEGK